MMLKKMEWVLIIGLVIAIILHMVSFAACCSEVRNDVLRLHILANSDSEEDQALKLRVRDAVLNESGYIFEGVTNVRQARREAKKELNTMQRVAQKTVLESGYTYPVTVSLEKCFFETRYYESFTLPAGEYEALRIVIGKGEGHNWWCVMFPQLCLASCAEIEDAKSLSEEEKQLISSSPQFEIRFKCVEIYEKIKKIL